MLMAAKLLTDRVQDGELFRPSQRPKAPEPLPNPMNRESQARFVAVLLFLLTVAAVVFAGFNFQKEREFPVPDDGVWWVEHGGKLVADGVVPSGPRSQAGVKPGDELVAVKAEELKDMTGLAR